MLLKIPDILTAAEVAEARQILDKAEWTDGKVTAGYQSAKTKDNMQIPEGHPAAQQLGRMILAALGNNPLFVAAALPRHIFPPLFNRYTGGQSFGTHVDNAIRQVTGTPHRIRTDISATLFFSEPGGIRRRGALRRGHLRAAQGEAARRPHGALPGQQPPPCAPGHPRRARLLLLLDSKHGPRRWQRSILFDLDLAIQRLNRETPDHPAAVQFTGVYHNLLRQWAEV